MVWVLFLAHVKEPCAFSQDFFSLEETVSDMEICVEKFTSIQRKQDIKLDYQDIPCFFLFLWFNVILPSKKKKKYKLGC